MQEQATIRPNRRERRAAARGGEPERLLYTIDDARRALGGIGRSTLYRLIDAGKVERVKFCGRAYLKVESVQRLIAEHTESAAAE